MYGSSPSILPPKCGFTSVGGRGVSPPVFGYTKPSRPTCFSTFGAGVAAVGATYLQWLQTAPQYGKGANQAKKPTSSPTLWGRKIATLSQGQYEEGNAQPVVLEFAGVWYDTKQQRIVKIDTTRSGVAQEVMGRFVSVDPLTTKYPELTPYQFASNQPIMSIDLDGLESWPSTRKWNADDFEQFSIFVKKEIEHIHNTAIKTDATGKPVDVNRNYNTAFDCADLYIYLIAKYASIHQLPVKFTLSNGKVVTNETKLVDEAWAFKGKLKIQPNTPEGFMFYLRENVNAASLVKSLVRVKKINDIVVGDMYYYNGHVCVTIDNKPINGGTSTTVISGTTVTYTLEDPNTLDEKNPYVIGGFGNGILLINSDTNIMINGVEYDGRRASSPSIQYAYRYGLLEEGRKRLITDPCFLLNVIEKNAELEKDE